MKCLLYVLTFSIFLSGCDSDNKTSINQDQLSQLKLNQNSQSPQTQQMIQRLETIVEYIDPMTSSFMNNEQLKILKAITSLDYSQKNINPILQLANQHLYAGNSDKAAELFNGVFNFLEQNKGKYTLDAINKVRLKLIVAYMRMGEQSNCIMLNASTSCIFPLDAKAVHLNQEGSKKAIRHLEILLEKTPQDVSLRWLYTIAKQTVGEYENNTSERKQKWLIDKDKFKSEYKISKFENRAAQNLTAINDVAGGSVFEDLNNDGYIDLMVSSWGFDGRINTFINDKKGGFIDTTKNSGLVGLMGGLNMIPADYDNDGDVDVLVLRGAWLMHNGRIPNSLLMNNGNGYFTDVTQEAQLLSFHPTQTAAWADINNDGFLDLFIGNESFGPYIHTSEFYLNKQDGTFEDITDELNLSIDGYVKGSSFGDYNNDGKIDLYVSIMDKHNKLLRNDSTKTEIKFTDVTTIAGVGEPEFSFPCWFWDYNNDGWLDIFVADYNITAYVSNSNSSNQLAEVINNMISNTPTRSSPRLFLNNKDGTFDDVTTQVALNKTLLAMGANFGDIDNDGFLDMYIGTGDPDFKTLVPNRMFRNNKGEIFQDITTSAGVGHLQKGHAISIADFDNDGDQDIYAVMGGAFSGDFYPNAFFENPGNENHWISLKLIGTTSNKSAIGARVEVVVVLDSGAISNQEGIKEVLQKDVPLIEKSIYRVVGTGGSFGANSLKLEIGLGRVKSIKHINIKWPGGLQERYMDIPLNQMSILIESNKNDT